MSYYKIIDGKRYDRQLLELAGSLVKGRGDGRISEEDAKQLFENAQDGGGINKTEKDTLTFITKRFKVTDNAKAWLKEAADLEAKKEEEKSEETVYDVMREVLGGTLEFYYSTKGVEEQTALPKSTFGFLEAFRRALKALVKDGLRHGDVKEDEVKKYLQNASMSLQPNIPYDPNEMGWFEFYDMYFFWPPHGENPADSWIFDLRYPYDSYDDSIYWIVVPRSGGEASVSSFN